MSVDANVEDDAVKTTEAFDSWQSNVNELKAFLKLLEADALLAVVKDGVESVGRVDQKELLDVEFVGPIVSRITAAVDKYLTRHRFVFDWIAVMLVTFLMAYLQENLERLAVKNPRYLENAPLPEIDYLLHAESIEDVRTELRRQWADKMLKGGPKEWFPRLRRLGASGITDAHQSRLQHLWDTRDLIVHNRASASVGYVRAYKHTKLAPGDRIQVNGNSVTWWLSELGPFVDAIDQFFVNYKGNAEPSA